MGCGGWSRSRTERRADVAVNNRPAGRALSLHGNGQRQRAEMLDLLFLGLGESARLPIADEHVARVQHAYNHVPAPRIMPLRGYNNAPWFRRLCFHSASSVRAKPG